MSNLNFHLTNSYEIKLSFHVVLMIILYRQHIIFVPIDFIMDIDISFIVIKIKLDYLWADFSTPYENLYDYLEATLVGSLIAITTFVHKLSGVIIQRLS